MFLASTGIRTWFEGPGFRVQGTERRVQGAGCRVQGSGSRVQGAGFRVQGAGHSHPREDQRLWDLVVHPTHLVSGFRVYG